MQFPIPELILIAAALTRRAWVRFSGGESGNGAAVWDFFNAHPLVFVVSLGLVLLALLYLVRLLVFNAGPDSEFRLGFLGLEYRRGHARSRPRRPGLLRRAWRALVALKDR